jgi:hypothetical protein
VRKWMDSKKREWVISLTLGDAREIEKATGFSFLDFQGSIPKLQADPWLLFDLCWHIVKDQVTANGIDQKTFINEGIAGSVETFRAVLFEAWADFLDLAGMSPAAKMLRRLNAKAAQVDARIDVAIDKAWAMVDAEIEKALGPLSLDSPPSPGSTGGP